jgi:hypothetical protein
MVRVESVTHNQMTLASWAGRESAPFIAADASILHERGFEPEGYGSACDRAN